MAQPPHPTVPPKQSATRPRPRSRMTVSTNHGISRIHLPRSNPSMLLRPCSLPGKPSARLKISSTHKRCATPWPDMRTHSVIYNIIRIYAITFPPAAYQPEMSKSRHASMRVCARPLFLITPSLPKSLLSLPLAGSSLPAHTQFFMSCFSIPHLRSRTHTRVGCQETRETRDAVTGLD